MKIVLSAASLLLLSSVVSGCALRSSTGELGLTEQQLVSDEQESTRADDDLESGLDEPLSGSDPMRPEAPESALNDSASSARMADLKDRARRHFQPEGCLTTTLDGLVATHVFNNCTGPNGLRTFNGTIVSTWAFEPTKASVSHRATDFKINGASISGSREVSYSKDGVVYTKVRVGDWSGTTAEGQAIRHQANFVSVYDANARCVVRNGSASSSLGARSFSRKVEGLEICGTRLRCPKAGTVTLARADKSIAVEFSGTRTVEITLPSGRSVSRQVSCIE
jgi:hypothetical protein